MILICTSDCCNKVRTPMLITDQRAALTLDAYEIDTNPINRLQMMFTRASESVGIIFRDTCRQYLKIRKFFIQCPNNAHA